MSTRYRESMIQAAKYLRELACELEAAPELEGAHCEFTCDHELETEEEWPPPSPVHVTKRYTGWKTVRLNLKAYYPRRGKGSVT